VAASRWPLYDVPGASAVQRFRLILAVVTVLIAGCNDSTSPPTDSSAANAIRIGSFNFTESEVLAELYAQGLEANGLPVARIGRVGSREVVEPALELGLLDIVPEYAGTLLEFVNLGSGEATADTALTLNLLRSHLEPRGLVALAPAYAQDRNAFVIRKELAATNGIRTISDLVPYASDLSFGGPSECPERFFCLAGLQEVYGLEFGTFVPFPLGSVVAAGLANGEIDVGLLFSTDPVLADPTLVVLADDQGLQPAENVTPVVRRDAIERWGPQLTTALDAISAELTTVDLVTLNSAANAPDTDIAAIVQAWLEDRGLFN
jgi:osmoprotectant transport system substrate-binding protein